MRCAPLAGFPENAYFSLPSSTSRTVFFIKRGGNCFLLSRLKYSTRKKRIVNSFTFGERKISQKQLTKVSNSVLKSLTEVELVNLFS